jgi:hypothetical protein
MHWILALLCWVNAGCVSYEPSFGEAQKEILADEASERSVAISPLAGSVVTVTAIESWQRHWRETRPEDGDYQVESLFLSSFEEPELLVLSPLLVAMDLLGLVVTGPIALLDGMFSSDRVRDVDERMSTPVAGIAVRVSVGSWSAEAATDERGAVAVNLQQPAAMMLERGDAMTYRVDVEVEGVEPLEVALSLPDTVACAAPSRDQSPTVRFAYWQDLLSRCTKGESRQAVANEADRVNPEGLRNYRRELGLPSAMSLGEVEAYRDLKERCAAATAGQDYSGKSSALMAMCQLLAQHDAAAANRLEAQSVECAAAYVADYYKERSLRSTPTFLVRYCRDNLKVADRQRDERSAAILSTVLAVRAGDARKLRGGPKVSKDRVVAALHRRAGEELDRQRSCGICPRSRAHQGGGRSLALSLPQRSRWQR